MTDPTSRMLRLLSLLQTYRYWSGPELAGRLEVTERTLRRDIERLRDLGYPVNATRGAAGGYRLDAGGHLPPLLFDDEEAVALAVGLRTSAGAMVSGIEESSVRALAKLEQVLPSRLRRRVNALGAFTVPLTSAGSGATVDPESLTLIAGACRDSERLRFAYRARDDIETTRHAEPYRLVSTGRRWYLVAYDLERDDWRTFRLDRLTRPFATGARFAPRALPGGDAAEFVRQSIAGPSAQLDAVVTAQAPTEVIRRWLRDEGTVEAITAQSCRVSFSGDSVEWMAVWLGMWGCDFEVHEPPELVDQVQRLHERFGRATPEYTQRGDLTRSMELVWDPDAVASDVVRVAIEIADADGLPAVALRRVADRLGVDVTTVHAVVPGKPELLDAMTDAVMAEAATVQPPGAGWRAGLEAIARTNWALFRRHPWLVQLVTVHPPLGPNLMAKWESELAVVEPTALSDVEKDAAVSLVLGHVQASVRAMQEAEQAAERTGASDAEWWAATEPMLAAAFDAHRFPLSARIGAAAGEAHQGPSSPEHAFEFGLQRVLDGVDALVRARATTPTAAARSAG